MVSRVTILRVQRIGRKDSHEQNRGCQCTAHHMGPMSPSCGFMGIGIGIGIGIGGTGVAGFEEGIGIAGFEEGIGAAGFEEGIGIAASPQQPGFVPAAGIPTMPGMPAGAPVQSGIG